MMIRFFILALIWGCAQNSKNTFATEPAKSLSLGVFNGHVSYFEFDFPKDTAEGSNLFCRDKIVPFGKKENGKGFAYIAQDYFVAQGSFSCELRKGVENINISLFKVKKFPYKEEKFNVDEKKVNLSAEDAARAAKESEMLNQVYAVSMPAPLYTAPFVIPLESFRTSIYGNRRVLNKSKKTQHLGNDFRAAVGVDIPVSNAGIVVFTGDLFFSGNTVIVDHGLGIFTMYAHLSEVAVKKGDILTQKQILGKAGMTGRASGPHLHWGVKVHGLWVDGFSLVEESLHQFQ
jgi:murein DD-endopeptidase MepM/ murein hydrolase activator NlpD